MGEHAAPPADTRLAEELRSSRESLALGGERGGDASSRSASAATCSGVNARW